MKFVNLLAIYHTDIHSRFHPTTPSAEQHEPTQGGLINVTRAYITSLQYAIQVSHGVMFKSTYKKKRTLPVSEKNIHTHEALLFTLDEEHGYECSGDQRHEQMVA